MTNELLLQGKNLGKEFVSTTIFEGIDIAINKGEVIALLGPSGCGKTTLLRCLAGLEQLSHGQVLLEKKDITYEPAEQRPIVMMFQQPLLFPHMNVLENVAYSLKFQGESRKSRTLASEKFLELVEMQNYSKRYPFELSGGQQQRVALARALVTKPQLLLLDEPFSSLDPELRENIRSWVLKLLKKEGVTALLVTHDKEEAMMLGDRVAILIGGVLQQIGSPLEVYEKPRNKTVAQFFCDGLLVNQNEFIPVNKIIIESPENFVRRDNYSVFEGEVLAKWIKAGQLFYRISIVSLKQEFTLINNENFAITQKVLVSFSKQDKYLITP